MNHKVLRTRLKSIATILCLALILGMFPPTQAAQAIKKIGISGGSLVQVNVGKSVKLKITGVKKATIGQIKARIKRTKKKKNIAAVNTKGKKTIIVKGKKEGNCKILVTVKLKKAINNKKKYKLSKKISVKDASVVIPSSEPDDGLVSLTLPTLTDRECVAKAKTPIKLDATVKAIHPAEAADAGWVEYQWYATDRRPSEDDDEDEIEGTPIQGATSPIFLPDITKVGTFYYYCEASFIADKTKGSIFDDDEFETNIVKIVVKESDTATVTFHGSGGTFKDATKAVREIKKGNAIGSLPAAGDLDYPETWQFVGWVFAGGGYTYVFPKTVITEDTDLYAVWSRPGDWNSSSGSIPPAQRAEVPTIVGPADEVVDNGYTSPDPHPLKVEATASDGGTLSYQWFVSSQSDTGFTEIANWTSSTLNLTNDARQTAGAYVVSRTQPTYFYCLVTNTVAGKPSASKKSRTACVEYVNDYITVRLILAAGGVELGNIDVQLKESGFTYSADDGICTKLYKKGIGKIGTLPSINLKNVDLIPSGWTDDADNRGVVKYTWEQLKNLSVPNSNENTTFYAVWNAQ